MILTVAPNPMLDKTLWISAFTPGKTHRVLHSLKENVEMQIKAAGLRVTEIPVRYRKRIGKSKVSGTLLAGWKIVMTIFKYGIHLTTIR